MIHLYAIVFCSLLNCSQLKWFFQVLYTVCIVYTVHNRSLALKQARFLQALMCIQRYAHKRAFCLFSFFSPYKCTPIFTVCVCIYFVFCFLYTELYVCMFDFFFSHIFDQTDCFFLLSWRLLCSMSVKCVMQRARRGENARSLSLEYFFRIFFFVLSVLLIFFSSTSCSGNFHFKFVFS